MLAFGCIVSKYWNISNYLFSNASNNLHYYYYCYVFFIFIFLFYEVYIGLDMVQWKADDFQMINSYILHYAFLLSNFFTYSVVECARSCACIKGTNNLTPLAHYHEHMCLSWHDANTTLKIMIEWKRENL